MHDLVIRGGTVVDGTGGPRIEADVAVDGDRIVAVGEVDASARRTIDADGALVTPGWVDVHTHFDGQVTWDPLLSPSSGHGVTTVVMGNCGVGFAPVRPGQEDFLIGLMEGVEEIPGDALAKGMPWGWESYPEYLDVLATQPRVIDVGGYLAHGALRAYVMGERGARNEPATDDDLEQMNKLARHALEGGALGVSTSRTTAHRAVDGEPVPGTFADERELIALATAVAATPGAVLEVVPAGCVGEDVDGLRTELEWIGRLSVELSCPITFLMLQPMNDPDGWREMLATAHLATERGATVRPQLGPRPISVLIGFGGDRHPFAKVPSFAPLAALPLAERVARLRDPEVRRRLLAEQRGGLGAKEYLTWRPELTFPIGDPPDYEPRPEQSAAAIAQREGRDAMEVVYDLLLEDDGRELLLYPVLNFNHGNCDDLREMLMDPLTLIGGSDAGAHVGTICDASLPTWMLTHWARDRTRGEGLPLEHLVFRQTADTAHFHGLRDRGVVAPGFLADLNVIDFERLALRRPETVFDLPGGARRLIQRADGYVATVVHGEVVTEEGVDTGARPGRVVRLAG